MWVTQYWKRSFSLYGVWAWKTFVCIVVVVNIGLWKCGNQVGTSDAAIIEKIRVAHNFHALNEDSHDMILSLRSSFIFFNYDCSRASASRKKCDRFFDIATLSNNRVYETYKHWVEHSKKPLSIAFPEEPKSILLFDNKFIWKLWMQRIGLEQFVPSTLASQNMTFPSVMKVISSRHHDNNNHFGAAGKGVYVLNSLEEYDRYSEHLRMMGSSFFVEELIGAGDLREGVMFGSFYQGQLLALRCIERRFSPSAFPDQYVTGGAFISRSTGSERANSTSTRISCTYNLAKTVVVMMREARYAGVFCIDFKTNVNGQVKFLEVNPRLCSTLAVSASLFSSMYVPLAFAVEERRQERMKEEFEEVDDQKLWFSNSTLRELVLAEKSVATSGIDPMHKKLLIM
jgi:hypothetical protein